MGIWIFVIFHCVLCLVLYVLMKAGLLKSSSMIMALVFLVPIFGFCCLLFLEWESRGDLASKKEVGIEKLKINDEIHRSILMEEDPAQELMVPLQEALLMNDASTRRELMMDILYDDVGEYVEVLKRARMNDDTEVVHYATTAMVELQKDYESRLKETRMEYEQDEDDGDSLQKYVQILEKYVDSGLPEGNVKKNLQITLGELLEKQIVRQRENGQEDLQLYRKKFENDLCLEEDEDAQEKADYVMLHWSSREEGYLMKIRYAVQKKDREEIRRVIGLLTQRKIYLSPGGRKTVEFWKDDHESGKSEKEVRVGQEKIQNPVWEDAVGHAAFWADGDRAVDGTEEYHL